MATSPQSSFFGHLKNLDVRQLRRNWLSILVAIAAFGFAAAQIWSPEGKDDEIWRIILTLSLGISLFLVPGLVFDGDRDSKRRYITLVSLGIFYFLYAFMSRYWSSTFFFYKTLQGFALFHLLVSLTPYLRERLQRDGAPLAREIASEQSEKSFWSENWFLLNRFNMAAIQSVLLMVGLLGAVFSVEKLFGLKIPGQVYATLVAFMIAVASVVLFIGSLGDHKMVIEPPEILKRIVRTVLTPLGATYIVILYAYTIKIGIAREWPRGGLGFLVSGLALVTTLSYVIMRPLATSAEFGSKLKLFWSYSFRMLIIPTLVLLLALGRRVSEYGWTEQRAGLGWLGLWMLGISLYYWNPNRRSLVGIPLSLAALCLVTWFGPLSPSFIGEKSQSARLEKLLAIDRANLTKVQKYDVNRLLEHLCKSYGPGVMAKSAGVEISEPKPVHSYWGYATMDLSLRCDDYGQPNKRGPVTEALEKLNIEKLEWNANQEPVLADLTFARDEAEGASFEDRDFATLQFNEWEKADSANDIEAWVTKGAGPVRLRFSGKLSALQWEAKPGTWKTLDLAPVAKAMIERRRDKSDKQVKHDDESRLFRVIDVAEGRKIEIQVILATFKQADEAKISSLHLFALVSKMP